MSDYSTVAILVIVALLALRIASANIGDPK